MYCVNKQFPTGGGRRVPGRPGLLHGVSALAVAPRNVGTLLPRGGGERH